MCDVNIATGEVSQFAVDFALPGMIPVHFVRTYSSTAVRDGPLGFGWQHNLEISVQAKAGKLRLSGYEASVIEFEYPSPERPVVQAAGLRITAVGGELCVTERDRRTLIFAHRAGSAGVWDIARKIDPYGNVIEFFRSEGGQLKGLRDTAGRVVAFRYDQGGRLIEAGIRTDDGKFERLMAYEFDHLGDLVSVQDRANAPYRYRYQEHLLVEVTNRIGGSTYYQYDTKRRCVRSWRDNGVLFREIRYFDAKKLVAVMDSRGFITIYKNNEMNLTEQQTDPLGVVKTDVFDKDGKLLLTTSITGGVEQLTTYDEESGRYRVSTPSGSTEFALNEFGQPLAVTTPEGGVHSFEYDHGGSLTRHVSPTGAKWRFEYDERGHLVCATDPTGFRTRKDRDPGRTVRLADDLGAIWRMTFDLFGNVREAEDAVGAVTHFRYDLGHRLVGVRYPDGTSSEFEYDAEGNLLRAQDETGLTTHYRYDTYGSLLEILDPANRSLRLNYDTEENLVQIRNCKGELASFEYDEVGRLAQITYFDGRIQRATYDDADNVVAVHNGQGQLLVEYEYDGSRMVRKRFSDGEEVTIAYGAQNQIVGVANRTTSISYEWDADMRIAKEINGTAVVEYEYDAVGNRTLLRTNGGREIRYCWDGRRRLVEMTDSAAISYRYEYNALNLVTCVFFPQGLVEEFNYDRANRMSRRSVGPVGASARLTGRDFSYDGASRLAEATDLQRGRVRYAYDRGGRLIEVRHTNGQIESYAYDDDDNPLVNSRGEAVTVGDGNRVLAAGTVSYEYDEAGNQILKRARDGDTHYAFSLSGELSRITAKDGNSVEYRYDPLGRRISKKQGDRETQYLWDGVSLLSETDPDGPETRYLFMPGSFFPAGVTAGDEHYSYSIDQLGTPTEMFDSNGDLVWVSDFTAFGDERGRTPFRNPLRFQGQYFDGESGLCYNRHRYYDPVLGRFISQDPIGFDGGPNLYRYVPNPINWVDPFGLFTCEIQIKCSWSNKQREEAQKKMAAMNDKIGNGMKVPSTVPAACANRKNAKDIYEDCKKDGHKLPDLKETSSKCSNEQADHIIEVCAGGSETKCDNLQPLNQSVNASFGAQIANCVKSKGGQMLKGIIPKPGCRPGGRKCPDV